MKNRFLSLALTIFLIFLFNLSTEAQASNTSGKVEQAELIKNWSLFFEYHKNGEFVTAVPYGWNVYRLNPTRFKALYSKLADCYYSFYKRAKIGRLIVGTPQEDILKILGEPSSRDENVSYKNKTASRWTYEAERSVLYFVDGKLKGWDRANGFENPKAYADTMLMIYDYGIKHVPDRAASFWLAKGFASENYYDGRELEAIAAYAKAIELDFASIDLFYVDRLGILYAQNVKENPNFRQQAIDLYQKVLNAPAVGLDLIKVGLTQTEVTSILGQPSKTVEAVYQNIKTTSWIYEKENAIIYFADGKVKGWVREGPPPSKEIAAERLRRLVTDPKELVEIAEKRLTHDPENLEKMWEAVIANRDAELWESAEKHLQKLVKKQPKNATYWNELGKVQQRQLKFKPAIDSYETALKNDPSLKENYLNVSTCYRMLGNYTAARSSALRAARADRSWGRPYFEIAEIYKSAVEKCVMQTKAGDWSKLDIDDKLVYKLAQDNFARAKAVEPVLANEANQRITELSTLVPAKEDLFFFRSRIRDGKMTLQSPCYGWIGEAVSVPTF